MEAECGVISDLGVIIFVVTDGVTDCAPVSSSVTRSPRGGFVTCLALRPVGLCGEMPQKIRKRLLTQVGVAGTAGTASV